jgi:hypothetical protein
LAATAAGRAAALGSCRQAGRASRGSVLYQQEESQSVACMGWQGMRQSKKRGLTAAWGTAAVAVAAATAALAAAAVGLGMGLGVPGAATAAVLARGAAVLAAGWSLPRLGGTAGGWGC